jgi:hypothetical protein
MRGNKRDGLDASGERSASFAVLMIDGGWRLIMTANNEWRIKKDENCDNDDGAKDMT